MSEATGVAGAVAWGAATDRGSVRTLNEDSHLAAFPVFVVADGMGGHDAGDRASALAVESLRGLIGSPSVQPDTVRGCLVRAHEAVGALESEPGRSAGTTVSGAFITDQGGEPYWLVVNVGDSRTYRLSGGVLEQVSVDHSEVQELLESGRITAEEAIGHPLRNVVTRALGGGVPLEPDFWLLPVDQDDRILICSDGLTTEVPDSVIADLLLGEPDPRAAAESLVRTAVEAGGRDNVTAVVVDVREVPGRAGDQTAVRGESQENEDTVPSARARERGLS